MATELPSSDGRAYANAVAQEKGEKGFHPHVHAAVLHGATDQHGVFQSLATVDTDYLCRCFQERLFAALLKENLVDQSTIDNMRGWEHSGFQTFVGKPIPAGDADSRLFVARYLKKCPISLQRLELIETGSETVVRYHKIKDGRHESRDFTPLEFLAAASSHIPDQWEQTTRYLGTLSARARGVARQRPVISELSSLEPARKPSRTWAQCMKKTFEIDPLLCPKSVFALWATT